MREDLKKKREMAKSKSDKVPVEIVGFSQPQIDELKGVNSQIKETERKLEELKLQQAAKSSVIKTDACEIVISEKDQKLIDERRQIDEANRKQWYAENLKSLQSKVEEEERAEELQKNYEEYNQYMRMIGNVLGIPDEDMAGANKGAAD